MLGEAPEIIWMPRVVEEKSDIRELPSNTSSGTISLILFLPIAIIIPPSFLSKIFGPLNELS